MARAIKGWLALIVLVLAAVAPAAAEPKHAPVSPVRCGGSAVRRQHRWFSRGRDLAAARRGAILPIRLMTICVFACLSQLGSLHAAEHKKVLILHSVGREFRPWNEYAKQIRAELDRQSPWPLDVGEHSLESARSGDSNPEPLFVQYLNALYAERAPDLIVAIGAPAAAFLRRHREHLFPKAPALLTAIDQRRLQDSDVSQNDALVVVKHDFRFLFESFLRISPDTKIVAIINGNSPNELFWRNEIQKELRPLEGRVDIRWYDNLSFQDILKQTAHLPSHSAIFWNTMVVDAANVTYEGDRALKTLYATANAPIFTHDDSFFGQEIVGGPMLSARMLSKQAGTVAVRLLAGEKPDGMRIEPVGFTKPIYDWRELRRWGISESGLPPDSEVHFREPAAWTKYRTQFLLICGVILLQSGLISGLLFERRRRLHAEVESRQRSAELAHINRFSMAGELTATIAHEINQPLGAMLTNVETAEIMVKSPAPDLHEIGEILADIRRDDMRASEVIGRLRSLLKKAPFELKDIDLNDVTEETVRFLSALAIAREVDLVSLVAPVSLPIKGDHVQLQQVILNLIVNAMDAMSGMPSAERRIKVSTARDGDSACISVSDVGPGIPVKEIKEVFEPFFTTKPQGMGMGLSIARTIVEAHGGQLLAENLAGRGAAFCMSLPLTGLSK
jgi:signal transduction histidine kinase